MDAEHRRMTTELRRMPSAGAADWLMSQFPRDRENWGTALLLLDHISLARQDNLRLARHYLTGLPFANGRPYEVFAKRLSALDLVEIIRERLPSDASRLDLLVYYLKPVLQNVPRSPKGDEAIQSLLGEIDRA